MSFDTSSDVDTVADYLDALFDRLAGTGAAGRRALAEVEDHLRASVEAGADPAEAVRRFGSPGRLVRDVRRSAQGSLWGVVGSSLVILAVIGAFTVGIALAVRAVELMILRLLRPDGLPTCRDGGPMAACSRVPHEIFTNGGAGFMLLVAAGIGYGCYRMGVYRLGVPRASRHVGMVGVPALTATALWANVDGRRLDIGGLGGGPLSWVLELTSLAMAIAVMAWSLRQTLPRRSG